MRSIGRRGGSGSGERSLHVSTLVTPHAVLERRGFSASLAKRAVNVWCGLCVSVANISVVSVPLW